MGMQNEKGESANEQGLMVNPCLGRMEMMFTCVKEARD